MSKINKASLIKSVLVLYTVLFLGIVIFAFTSINKADPVVYAQQDNNNCCYDSDWTNGNDCDNQVEWENGYYACLRRECSCGGIGNGQVGAYCDPAASNCDASQNLHCTPNAQGQYVCNQDAGGTCGAGDECGRVVAYRCNDLSEFVMEKGQLVCYNNPIPVGSFSEGLAQINGCGQVDTVCKRQDKTCGDFQIQTHNCSNNGGGGNNPVTVSCNESCNGTSRVCVSGLTCTANGVCRLPSNPSSVTCQPANNNQPAIDITKTLANGEDGIIEIGEIVNFRIVIRNTGNTTLQTINFSDTYELAYLTYDNNQAATFTINNSGNVTNGTFVIQGNDGSLTHDFVNVNLTPNSTITINIPFRGNASTANETDTPVGQTRNVANVTSGNLTDQDIEDVTVNDSGEPEIVSCNESCNGTSRICATGLTCTVNGVCRLPSNPSSLTCEPAGNTPAISIDKRFSAGYSNNFEVDDIVSFDIDIRNTGNVSFNNLSFSDTFDAAYLEFLSGTATLNSNQITINNSNATITSNSISISNLVALFSEQFDPNETISLTFRFIATSVGDTENIAIADTDQTNPVQDDQDVTIVEENMGENPVVDIDKTLNNDVDNDQTYLVGEDVIFQVRIENKGNTTFDVVQFSDSFDPAYLALDLTRSYIQKSTGVRVSNLSTVFQSTTNSFSHSDLTTIGTLGNLAPGEFYDLVIFFEAIQDTTNSPNGNTQNLAIVTADGLVDQDTENVIIEEGDEIVTVGCNEICNSTNLCNASQNQICVNLGSENRCRLATNTASETCQPASNETPVIEIDKYLRNDVDNDSTFFVGDDVIFTVRIENKGNTTFNIVRFEDIFDSNYLGLDLSRSYIQKNTGLRINNLTNYVTGSNGSIVISDITTIGVLGNLAPGQYFDVVFYFEALQTTSGNLTRNLAIVTADGERDQDDEFVEIINENQVVTVGCNEICGSNRICDATGNLVCVGVGQQENRCRLSTNLTSATCEGAVGDEDPRLNIDKTAIPQADGQYSVGEEMQFRIQVTNTGVVDATRVRFIDQYEANYFDFLRGRVEKYNANNIRVGELVSITDYLNINQDGYLEVSNLAATPLGTLRPGQYYVIELTFLTQAPGSTTNIAITEGEDSDGDQTGRIEDRETVFIGNINTDV